MTASLVALGLHSGRMETTSWDWQIFVMKEADAALINSLGLVP